MKRLALFCVVMMLFLGGCVTDTPPDKKVTVKVASYKTPCVVQEQQLCMNTKIADSDDFYCYYGEIEDFGPRWGTTYEIFAKVIQVDDSLTDSPASCNRLKIIEQTSAVEDEIGMRYDYEAVEMAENTFTEAQGKYFFLNVPFACAPDVDCDTLAGSHNPFTTVDLVFQYTGNGQIRLASYTIHTNTEFIETKSFPFDTYIAYAPATPPTTINITDSVSLEKERVETYKIESQADLDTFNQSLAPDDQPTAFSVEDHTYFLIKAPGCPDFYYNAAHSFTENVLTISMDHYRSIDEIERTCTTDTNEVYFVFTAEKPEAVTQ